MTREEAKLSGGFDCMFVRTCKEEVTGEGRTHDATEPSRGASDEDNIRGRGPVRISDRRRHFAQQGRPGDQKLSKRVSVKSEGWMPGRPKILEKTGAKSLR